MFTGLIEEIGEICELTYTESDLYITVKADKVIKNIKIGDSVAINGACQTVIDYTDNRFQVFASSETLAVTNFKELKVGSKVNLERTLRLCDRLDGHIVSGHIDGLAKIIDIKKQGETTIFCFSTEKIFSKQIVKKGSVAIDGISLTVSNINENIFEIAVIPHSLIYTNLQFKKIGDFVNLETDLISKYVEKYLLSNHNNSNIDMNFLERNGFL